ncbi:hypothetical protein CBOM_06059 [Ceraceosorus bombacis]|uniref:Autophagy-related protein n=1 Tax=Ceraceosorus bombacis TaxID=401625 RepID=A0A0N7LAC4_9BASI|nr:hypothetical protein CBOM_06059 [Ceraceosorus bombacis]
MPLPKALRRPAHTRQTTNLVDGVLPDQEDASGDQRAATGGVVREGNEHANLARPASLDHNGRAISRTATPSTESTEENFKAALLTSGEDTAALDARYETSKWECWAYYVYYIGNSGLGPFNYSPSQAQNLLTLAAEKAGNGTCGGDAQPVCRLRWAGQDRTVQSIVLLANGISFAIQAALFLIIGSMADYGRWRPYVLIVSTLISIGISFAWLGVTDADNWRVGIALYILGLIGYQVSLTYWTSAFPGLARNLPEMRESAEKLQEVPPRTTPESHHELDTMTRNRIANIAFAVCSAGELVVLAIIQGMLVALHSDASTESNTRALSIVTAFSGGVWFLVALPWFILEKHRPGRKLPAGHSYLTAGIVTAWTTAKHIWQLKQSLLYLAFYFIMGDALNTSVTVISTVQNQLISFSGQTFNLLLIVGIAAQGVGIYSFWRIQKHFALTTTTMLRWVVLFIILLQLWGLVGIWTLKFGFHNVWEAYAYQAFYGLVVCPWYAYSQTGISEASPKGYEFAFFSLLNLVGRTSSFIGPFVSSAIAQYGNESYPFGFLLGMAVLGGLLLIPMDAKKGRQQQARFIARQSRDARTQAMLQAATHQQSLQVTSRTSKDLQDANVV